MFPHPLFLYTKYQYIHSVISPCTARKRLPISFIFSTKISLFDVFCVLNNVKLPQYAELLIENGFEDMESITDITIEHLREMGLMNSVAKLKALEQVGNWRECCSKNEQ